MSVLLLSHVVNAYSLNLGKETTCWPQAAAKRFSLPGVLPHFLPILSVAETCNPLTRVFMRNLSSWGCFLKSQASIDNLVCVSIHWWPQVTLLHHLPYPFAILCLHAQHKITCKVIYKCHHRYSDKDEWPCSIIQPKCSTLALAYRLLLIVNILVELDQSRSYLDEGYVNEVQSTSCLVTEIFTQCSEQNLIDYLLNFRTHKKIHIFSLIRRAWQYVVTEISLWSITRWITSLVVQWLWFCAPNEGALGSIPLDPTFCN